MMLTEEKTTFELNKNDNALILRANGQMDLILEKHENEDEIVSDQAMIIGLIASFLGNKEKSAKLLKFLFETIKKEEEEENEAEQS